ncbi:disease resistance protein RGA2 [Oryza brachyantha]|uniref:NBS-LRR disease resistance protein family-4 n=1 Tax=Oryza brachyantha TaxID=4533 RepID=B9V0H6_ORYBR|nr:disease resistance protein RGA2 [Oryza brachyantha]ACM17559.1 NBS-LRR disease resistance protein family-4 [Oryza brachyantha]
MGEVGGMLTAAILRMAGDQIGAAVGGQMRMQWEFDGDLEDVKMTLETISASLRDAERRSIKSEEVLLWLRRLRDAAYDISDMIDEFELDTIIKLNAPTKCATIMCCLTVRPKIKMANNMKEIRVRLEKITKQHKDFNFILDSSSDIKEQNVLFGDRLTSPKVEEATIFGRNEDKSKIVNNLSKKMLMEDFIVLAICGMGGIGKTTLAQLVFNDKHFKEYYPVWVYVSQVFDLNKIERSIISQLSKRMPKMTDLDMAPPDMNVIIVLDDLWEKDGSKLEKLKAMLTVNKEGKMIIIATTRDESIAKRFSTIEPYHLDPLTDDMCWKIIKEKSDFVNRNDKDQLEQIGREIARKCGGVALAAQSLGYTLYSKRFDEWESIKNNDIWNESTSEDTSSPHHVLASLKLSYVRMRPGLKMCFGYCAIFPKGQKIVKDDLIHQWISLGFIEPSRVYSPIQLVETYATELLAMSFLQHPKSLSATAVHDENVTLFSMHDLVHDLARSVMVGEILVSSNQDSNPASSYRYALLNDSRKPLNSFSKFASKIRALRFADCAKTGLGDDAFSGAKYLRVLDLSECSVQKLPCSICQLRHLRYLSAPGIQDAKIPDCMTKLSNLVYLHLGGSSKLRSLPESIGEMHSLTHLDLSGCSGIQQLPQSFGMLKLLYLDLSNCSMLMDPFNVLGNLTKLQHLNLSYCKHAKMLGNLENLTELQFLNLSNTWFADVPEIYVLRAGTKLEYLNLSTEYTHIKGLTETMDNLIKLKYLNLSGWSQLEELPRSWRNLPNLMHLDLSDCGKIKGVPEALGGLSKLQYLNLSKCCWSNKNALRGLEDVVPRLTELRYLSLSNCLDSLITTIREKYNVGQIKDEGVCLSFLASLSSLSNLEELDLSNSVCLNSLPESISDLRNLHTLNLSRCRFLSHLPNVICEIDSLKHLNVSGCRDLDKSTIPKFDSTSILLPQFEVQVCNGESSSNLVLLENVKSVTELEIGNLENVVNVEEAQRVKLKEKEGICRLTLSWTSDARRFVEDEDVLGELEPPATLLQFMLKGYNRVSFPAWFLNNAHHHFPVLLRIDLVNLPNCTSLIPLGQLPKLEYLSLDRVNNIKKIDEESFGSTGAFRQLTKFTISNMEGLQEWQTTYSCGGFMFPKLRALEIHHCPNLILKPCPHKAYEWEIEGADNILSSWTGAGRFPVNNLTVKSCKLPFHRWSLLPQLTALNYLAIESCSDVSSSPGFTRGLTNSIQALLLKENDNKPVLQLPNWIVELNHLNSLHISSGCLELMASWGIMSQLTSLRSLTLFECGSLTSLPKWLGDLPSVQKLRICSCPSLNNLQGSIARLTSLQSLHLHSCESIAMLPESLGDLTSLKILEIAACTIIESLPESIHRLTNLVGLNIFECPELEKWCELENKTRLSNVLRCQRATCSSFCKFKVPSFITKPNQNRRFRKGIAIGLFDLEEL